VSRLEIAWCATEFPLQGVLIKSRQDILKVSSYGRTVTIDLSKSKSELKKNTQLPYVQKTRTAHTIKVHKQVQRPWRKFCRQTYEINKPIAQEIVQAKKLLIRVDEAFSELKTELKQISPQKVATIKAVSNEIVASLLDNPDALLWLTKVKAEKSKIYDHTVRTSIWAILMGRSINGYEVKLVLNIDHR